MRLLVLTALTLMISASASAATQEQERMMNEIERTANLPAGAHSLSEYARFYYGDGDAQIIAAYVLPSVIKKLASEECSELTGLDTPMRDIPCVLPEVEKTVAGQRRWLTENRLPWDTVLGCEVIVIAYDVPQSRFDELSCVGHQPSIH